MKKHLILGGIFAAALITAVLAAGNIADAEKPGADAGPKIPLSDEMVFGPYVSSDGSIRGTNVQVGGSILYYGDTLCEISGTKLSGVIIQFGMDTLVEHLTDCVSNFDGRTISLDGGADVLFKKGDILALAPGANADVEIYRDAA